MSKQTFRNHRNVTALPVAATTPSDTASQRRCPCCMATVESWRPVIYGAVGQQVMEQARRGEVALGGMNHGRNEPRWHCTRCRTRFGRPREDLDRFGRAILTVKSPQVAAAPKKKAPPAWRTMPTMRIGAVTQSAA